MGEMGNYRRHGIMGMKELFKRQGIVGAVRNTKAALCKYKQL